MLRILAACGNGMGSSQIIKMKIEKVFKKLGVPVTIDHMSVGDAKSQASSYDVIFCSVTFTDIFKVRGTTKVIGLVNLLSESEIEGKIRENLTMPS